MKLIYFLILTTLPLFLIASNGKINIKFESPCIETVEPLPYDSDYMYMAYHQYQMVIGSGLGVPGINYPNAYLYVHEEGNFQNQITLTDALSFTGGEDNGTYYLSAPKTFNLENLTPFFSYCNENDANINFTANYEITIVDMSNGYPIPYPILYPELFPLNDFDLNSYTISAFHTFYCVPPPPLQGIINNEETDVKFMNKNFDSTIQSSSKVFPNPFVNQLNIDINANQLISVQIFNTKGQKVYEQLTNFNSNNKIRIEPRRIESGIYFLIVHTDKGVIRKKIIKS